MYKFILMFGIAIFSSFSFAASSGSSPSIDETVEWIEVKLGNAFDFRRESVAFDDIWVAYRFKCTFITVIGSAQLEGESKKEFEEMLREEGEEESGPHNVMVIGNRHSVYFSESKSNQRGVLLNRIFTIDVSESYAEVQVSEMSSSQKQGNIEVEPHGAKALVLSGKIDEMVARIDFSYTDSGCKVQYFKQAEDGLKTAEKEYSIKPEDMKTDSLRHAFQSRVFEEIKEELFYLESTVTEAAVFHVEDADDMPARMQSGIEHLLVELGAKKSPF